MEIGKATAPNREGTLARSTNQDALTLRLRDKIRAQARQLAELNETLQEEGCYSRLLERRLVELYPDHPLPVTPQHLGRGAGLSRLQQQQQQQQKSSPRERDDDREDYLSLRRGYAAAQERLKDAAQLIRTLREALASR